MPASNPFDDLLHPQPRSAQLPLHHDPFDDDQGFETKGHDGYAMDPFFDE